MSKFIKLSKSDFNLYMNDLKSMSLPFELHVNNNSLTIYEDGFAYYTSDSIEKEEEDIELNHLRFIFAVKAHVEQKIKEKILIPKRLFKQRINFFDPGKRRTGSTRDAVEVDIDSAYWETAYKENVVSGPIYRYGKTVPKKVRLMALGSLAKRTTVYVFDGKKMKRDRILRNPGTEYFWNKICKTVADVMTTVAAEIPDKNYYFYWVDAIFVSKSKSNAVKKMFAIAGYDYKTKKVEKITFSKKEIVVDKRKFAIADKTNRDKFLELIS